MRSRQSVLYNNHRVLDLNGRLIFTCNQRKIDWYLSRDLAELVSNNPLTIQLKFKTNGPGNAGDQFYLQYRDNVCVVCGSAEKLTRHHIFPRCYRKWLPESIKKHSYHDILPLCLLCHENYEIKANELKRTIAKEYNTPIEGVWDTENEWKFWWKIKSDAFALINYGHKIPEERKQFLIDRIRSNLREANYPDIPYQEIASRDVYDEFVKGKLQTHGRLVIDKVKDLEAFVRRWRLHFIETLTPKFLPKHWSIERGLK